MRLTPLLVLLAAGTARGQFLEAPAASFTAPVSAGVTPDVLRFFVAADAAPSRLTYGNPALPRIQTLRLEALQAPNTAPQKEDQLYSLLIPGFETLPPVAKEALLQLERRRAQLLVRVEEAKARLTPKQALLAQKLAVLRNDIVHAVAQSVLDRLEGQLNDLIGPAAGLGGAPNSLASLARLEKGASLFEQAKFHSLYGQAMNAKTAPASNAAFDGQKAKGGGAVYGFGTAGLGLPPVNTGSNGPKNAAPKASPIKEVVMTLPNPYPSVEWAGEKPVGMADAFWNKPLVQRAAKLIDGFGESLGVYDLLKKAGASDPRAFVFAIIQNESMWYPSIVSPAGAIGLMQVMPGTAGAYRAQGYKIGQDLTDIRNNIWAGMLCLRDNIAKFGRLDWALAAYNAGPGAVDKYKGIPPYKETQRYVPVVLREYARLTTPLPDSTTPPMVASK